MAELLGAIILGIGGGLTLVALLIVWVFLAPTHIDRIQMQLAARPGRSFLVGMVNFAFLGILAALLGQGGDLLGLAGALILLFLLALATSGLSGLLLLLRSRFYPDNTNPLSETFKTAVLLVAAGLAPVVGWFVFSPVALLMGLGATMTILLRRAPQKAVE